MAGSSPAMTAENFALTKAEEHVSKKLMVYALSFSSSLPDLIRQSMLTAGARSRANEIRKKTQAASSRAILHKWCFF
jgi:hypothetical protein